MNKPNVGDKVYLVYRKFNVMRKQIHPEYWTVIKVGRKYFTIKNENNGHEKVFNINDWREKTKYTSNCELYASEKEYIEHVEAEKWAEKLHNLFCGYSKLNIELNKYREIGKILDISITE